MSLLLPTQLYLKGIILVAHTTLGGDQLIFRYPPVNRNKISDETLIAMMGKSDKSDLFINKMSTISPSTSTTSTVNPSSQIVSSSSSTSTSIQSSTSTSSLSSSNKGNEIPNSIVDQPVNISYKDQYEPFQMPSVMLCNILSPKQQLCDKIFEVVIDDDRFIGYPTTIKKKSYFDNDDDLYDDDDDDDNDNININDDDIMYDDNQNDSYNDEIKVSYINNEINNNNSPDIQRNYSSLSNPKRSNSLKGSGSYLESSSSSSSSHKDELIMFNLVVVVSKNIDKPFIKTFKRITRQLSVALKHEQQRCQYLSNEISIMLKCREKWLSHYQNESNERKRPDHTLLAYDILQNSKLAKFIKKVYHFIRDEGSLHSSFKNWLSISLSIKEPFEYDPSSFLPYKTCLIFDIEDCLKSLPYDSSPNLILLIENSNPMKSFKDLEIELKISLHQIFMLASHLEYWGKAKIIDRLSKENVYTLNPKIRNNDVGDLHIHSLSIAFEDKFSNEIDFMDILYQFSFQVPLQDNIYSTHDKFVDIIIWLLKNDLLIQIHPYYYLITDNDYSDDNDILSQYTIQHHNDHDYIIKKYSINPNDTYLVDTLKKLLPYLNGKYNLTEISYHLNMKKEDIESFIEQCNEFIITVYHE